MGLWIGILAALVAAAAVLAGAEIVRGTLDYTALYKGRILPHAMVEGVDVSGMTRKEALEAVRMEIAPRLDRRVAVSYRSRSWRTTPRQMGARSDARAAVGRALAESRRTSFIERARMRYLGDRLDYTGGIGIAYPQREPGDLVDRIASIVDRKPIDSELDYSSGWVEISEDRTGRKVMVEDTQRKLMAAIKGGPTKVNLPVQVLEPATTEEDYDEVILLRQGENRVHLYQNGDITRSYTVATGQPEYPTPTGVFEVTELRYMPTWINPDPTGWGASMPAEIAPGPSNPLGTRAINWSAPAIRFHGTLSTDTLGYNASHGCVRMAMSDVEEFYELVDVGTPIVSLDVAAAKPLYDSTPDPTVVNG